MRIVIDIIILAIVIYCGYSGFKQGIINAAVALTVMALSITGGVLVSGEFSDILVTSIRPFANGVVETLIDPAASEKAGLDDMGLSLDDAAKEEPGIVEEYFRQCFYEMGIYKNAADRTAEKAIALYNEGYTDTEAATEAGCREFAFVFGTVFMFVIFLLLFSVIINAGNLRFSVENDKLNTYGGAVAGVLRGLICCAFVCWIAGYGGIILGDTLSRSLLTKFIMMIL